MIRSWKRPWRWRSTISPSTRRRSRIGRLIRTTTRTRDQGIAVVCGCGRPLFWFGLAAGKGPGKGKGEKQVPFEDDKQEKQEQEPVINREEWGLQKERRSFHRQPS